MAYIPVAQREKEKKIGGYVPVAQRLEQQAPVSVPQQDDKIIVSPSLAGGHPGSTPLSVQKPAPSPAMAFPMGEGLTPQLKITAQKKIYEYTLPEKLVIAPEPVKEVLTQVLVGIMSNLPKSLQEKVASPGSIADQVLRGQLEPQGVVQNVAKAAGAFGSALIPFIGGTAVAISQLSKIPAYVQLAKTSPSIARAVATTLGFGMGGTALDLIATESPTEAAKSIPKNLLTGALFGIASNVPIMVGAPLIAGGTLSLETLTGSPLTDAAINAGINTLFIAGGKYFDLSPAEMAARGVLNVGRNVSKIEIRQAWLEQNKKLSAAYNTAYPDPKVVSEAAKVNLAYELLTAENKSNFLTEVKDIYSKFREKTVQDYMKKGFSRPEAEQYALEAGFIGTPPEPKKSVLPSDILDQIEKKTGTRDLNQVDQTNPKIAKLVEQYNQARIEFKRKVREQSEQKQLSTRGYSPPSEKVATIFEESGGQEKIIKINDRTFELGNFGRQHLDRKLEEGKGNRFEESLLPEALRDAKPYQASDNSASYRSDNAAWIGSIDGKPTVVYTRVNKNNAEEIIGWHYVDLTKNPNFIKTLESFGSLTGTRTRIVGLEDRSLFQSASKAEISVAQPQRPVKTPKQALEEAEAINRPTTPSQVKKAVTEAVSGTKPEKIIRRVDLLLRSQIRAEARTAKAVKKEDIKTFKRIFKSEARQIKRTEIETRQLTREELTAKFKDSRTKLEELRRVMVVFIKDKLPADVQGKFLPALQEDLSRKKTFRIFERINRFAEEVVRKEEIANIKELRLPKGGNPNIAVEYQKEIGKVFTDIDLAKPTEETLQRLKSLSIYLEMNKDFLDLHPELLERVQRLSQKPLRDMSADEVREIRETLEHLQKLGKLKVAMKNKYNERIREANRNKLIVSTRNIDPTVSDSSNPTAWERRKINAMSGYINTMQTARVADMQDGFKGYQGENAKMIKSLLRAETQARYTSDGLVHNLLQELRTQGIKEISEESQIKINIDLMAKQGAKSQVETLLKINNLKEIPELSIEEKFVADKLREYAGQFTDEIAAVAEEVKGVPFRKLKNYFPIKYQHDIAVAPEDTINQYRNRTTKTPQGFTEERVSGVEKTPRTDVFAVLEEAVNEQQWFMHLQPEINDIRPLVLSQEYAEAAGDFGLKFWRDYLDVVARRGWSASATNNTFLRERRINITNAILGYKVSTIVLQPFAVFDAMALTQPRHGTLASMRVLLEFSKAWVVPGVAEKTVAGSPALQVRAGGEVAIAENLERVKNSRKLYDKMKAGAMTLIQKADQRTAAGVQAGLEKVLRDSGVKNAKQEAEFLMNMTQGSAEISLRPLILSKGEAARTWFTFQTFFLNRWGIVAHDLIRSGLFASKGMKAKLNALIGLGILIAGGIAEEEAREALFKLARGRKPQDRTSTLTDALLFIPEQVPYFGNILSTAVDFGDASGAPPIVRVFEDAISGGISIFTSKKRETKIKGAIRLLKSVIASEFGIPGTFQVAELTERTFNEDEKKKTEGINIPSVEIPAIEF